MSDSESLVSCGEHGERNACFVCCHLKEGEALGFNLGYDPEAPDELYPAAWCDACEALLEQEGEWTDRAQAEADIQLACSACYELIRARNWRQDDEVLVELISSSFAYLQAQQERFMADYRIGSHERWDWDQHSGTLLFSQAGLPVVECRIDFVGSFSNRSDSWRWAWANDSFVEPVKARSREVRALGEELGLLPLACGQWAGDPVDGWEMTAVMARQLGAIGAYRVPSDSGFLYMTVSEARWVGTVA